MTEFELEDLDLNQSPSFDKYIPPARSGSLETLDLAKELYQQYIDTQQFLDDLLKGEAQYPPNQIIAVVNSMRTLLTDITKLRTDLYNAERLKALEAATISAIKNAPPDVQTQFFTEYKRSIDMLKAKK